jgi:hypothetical protein
MGGGTGTGSKRKISVGFMQPKKLEGDTIYVQLMKKFPFGHILADAVSNVKFDYITESTGGNDLLRTGVKATNRYGGISENDYSYKTPETFLKMLEKQNDAFVSEDRRNEEGLDLTCLLYTALERIKEFQEKVLFLEDIFK